MRRHGALGTANDLGMHDHACWIYDDDGERRKAVVGYFADGLRAGQRPPFRVFARPDALALEGEVDYFSASDLGRLLDVTLDGDGDVMLDLGGLGFVDHHGVMALAERRGLGFQDVPHPVARLSEVMGVAL